VGREKNLTSRVTAFKTSSFKYKIIKHEKKQESMTHSQRKKGGGGKLTNYHRRSPDIGPTEQKPLNQLSKIRSKS
jgi:hypothetical protein